MLRKCFILDEGMILNYVTLNVWVEILIKNKPVLTGTFYRPPNSNASVLYDIVTSIDLAHDTGIKDIIITGDFNLDLLNQYTRKQ